MSTEDNPFAKFKKQLSQKNNIENVLEEYVDDSSPAAEIDVDNLIRNETVKEMNLEPFDQSFQYVFFPKNDISTYDLARILAMTQLMITPEVYDKFPDDLKKHFTTFTELKN